MKCRFCRNELSHVFLSLGATPLSNAYLSKEQFDAMETFYPLEAYVCGHCFLVQLPNVASPENIFSDYAYFSSYSDTWLKHAKAYTDKMIKLFGLNNNSFVVEVASNDGYLLQYFAQKRIPVLGIEPAANIATVARKKGVPTETIFFGVKTAKRLAAAGKRADLLLGNNVLAHVPDLNDFVAGLKILLKPQGVITMEFPHLLRLIEGVQFDTIYHEHFSYFSYLTVEDIFSAHGLTVFDVEELPTHGGSLRIYARHKKAPAAPVSPGVVALREAERSAGLRDINFYTDFKNRVGALKMEILQFFIRAKKAGKTVVGYGAPAKGNTLLNFCGIKSDFIDYTVDKNPYKQGRYLPGSRIPVKAPEMIKKTKPDYIFILPWNIKDEVMAQISYVKKWGGRFVIPVPRLKVLG